MSVSNNMTDICRNIDTSHLETAFYIYYLISITLIIEVSRFSFIRKPSNSSYFCLYLVTIDSLIDCSCKYSLYCAYFMTYIYVVIVTYIH